MEVTLAVGIVAFGLVAVLSILPFGLTAQKNNQTDTILRYEAEYWFAALEAGGLHLESLHRVETIELRKDPDVTMANHWAIMDANGDQKISRGEATGPVQLYFDRWDADQNGTLDKGELNQPYRINRFDLSTDQAASWPADVCGWLSAPSNKVDSKYAYVRALNGSLYDRLSGLRGSSPNNVGGEYRLPGGEFAFGYILEVQVEPKGNFGGEISLTFHWPISENAVDALKEGYSIDRIMKNQCGMRPTSPGDYPETEPVKSKTFSILTGLRPRPALMEVNLDGQQLRFLKTGLPGHEISIADLENGPIFETRYSNNLMDKKNRQLRIDPAVEEAEVEVDVSAPLDPPDFRSWYELEKPIPDTRRESISEAFSENDIGWYVNIYDPGLKTYRIEYVYSYHKDGTFLNGHLLKLKIGGDPPNGAGPLQYRVTFLDPKEPTKSTWPNLLDLYERQGLGERFFDSNTGQEKWRFGSVYESTASPRFRNILFGDEFSVTLTPGENSPADAPLESPACSFWFLR